MSTQAQPRLLSRSLPRQGRAGPVTPNPFCTVCEGGGTDPDFLGDCTMCWPPGTSPTRHLRYRNTANGNRIDTQTGEVLPPLSAVRLRKGRKALGIIAAVTWMTFMLMFLGLVLVLAIPVRGFRGIIPSLCVNLVPPWRNNNL